MAKVILNPIFNSFRGRLGDVVFRQMYGKTVMYARPKPSPHPPTPAQLEQRARFLAAARARVAARRLQADQPGD